MVVMSMKEMKNLVMITILLLQTFPKGIAADQRYASLTLVEEPSDLTFLNTMQGSITCRTDGHPTPTVTWLTESGAKISDIPDIRTTRDNQLIFHNFKTNEYNSQIHNTKYRCKVASLAGEIISRLATVRAELDIRYSPAVYHQTTHANASAIFKCHLPTSMSNVIKTFGWYVMTPNEKKRMIVQGGQLDGIKVLITGELIVSRATPKYRGYKFACISRNILNNATITSSPALLFIDEHGVDFLPRNIIQPQNTVLTIGETLVLNCQASAYPPPVITWTKDGVKLSSRGRVTVQEGVMKITDTIQSDGGRYSCAINSEDKYQYSALVKVKVPLTFTEKPKSIHLKKEDENFAKFVCKATGSGPITVQWYRNGDVITDDVGVRISISSDSLTITNLDVQDEGVYQCFVRNEFENIQASAELVVSSTLPVITQNLVTQTVKSGDDVNLTCQFSGTPLPKVTWLYETTPLTRSTSTSITMATENSTTSSTLSLSNFQLTSSGTYTCLVENSVGEDRRTATINIDGKPIIQDFATSVNGIVGKPLYLHCMGRGFPLFTTTWKRWASRVTTDATRKLFDNGTLLIHSFSKNDKGDFECSVQNTNGETSRRVYVKIIEPPVIGPINVESVIAGSRTSFMCTCNLGSSDGLSITWYKDGDLASNVIGIKKGVGNQYTANLFIAEVKVEHRGRYTCVAKNIAGEMARTTDFVVYENAVFQVEPRDISVLFGHPVVFPCLATGFPTPQITWLKKSPQGRFTPLLLDHRVKQTQNGTLFIGVSQAIDDGEYMCKAFFDTEQPDIPELLSKNVKLEIKVPARVVRTSSPIARQEKGRAVSLVCSIIGTSSLKVKWFKNGGIIENDQGKYRITNLGNGINEKPSMLNSTMVISDVSTRDNATYECMGINMYGSHKMHFTIIVEERPSKPLEIQTLSTTSKSVQLSWVPGYDGNLKITEYTLEMSEEVEMVWESRQQYQVPHTNVFTVSRLHPGTRYTCRVKAKNRLGYSEYSDVTTISTQEEAPSSPPQNTNIKAIDKDKLVISWQHPPRSSRNGLLIGYRITYAPTSSLTRHTHMIKNVTIPSLTGYTLTNLLQFTGYRIQVQALTKAGSGPLSAPIFATTLEGVPSVAPNNVEVHALSTNKIVVSWRAVPRVAFNGVLKGYMIQYTDIEKKLHYQVPVDGLQVVLDDLRTFARYTIRVSAYTNAGLGVRSIEQQAMTFEDIPDKPAEFTAIPANPNEIVLTWKPPLHKNGIILNYIVYFKARRDGYERRRIVGPHKNTYRITKLKVKEEYLIMMKAVTSKGEGNQTQWMTTVTAEHVPARIITPKDYVIYKPIGSDVSLPCTAVGYPKPSIVWQSEDVEYYTKKRRWMAEDKPKLLYRITKDAEGMYNCTATNSYGTDWNIVTLKVQVPPSPTEDISTKLSESNGLYNINVTWTPGVDGNSPALRNHISYAIEGVNSDWLTVIIPSAQHWYMIKNITYDDVVYFKMASENAIGIGMFTQALKLVISPPLTSHGTNSIVRMSVVPGLFEKQVANSDNLHKFLKPILISAVAFITLLMILLLVASWDREERRIREPRCSRLLCTCSFRSRKEYNPDPYGEPGLLWPWNIKRNRHSGAFDMKDELLPSSSEDQIELKYRDSTALNYNALPSSDESVKNKYNDFEPVVLFTPSKTPDSQCFAAGKKQTINRNSNENVHHSSGKWDTRPMSGRYSSTPSIIEKYFQSQEPYTQNGFGNRYVDDIPFTEHQRDSVLSDESFDYGQQDQNINLEKLKGAIFEPTVEPPEYTQLYDDDPSKPLPPNYRDILNGYPDYSDAPRALFRKDGEPARRGKRNRKSLDSLLLKALEDIEEQEILTNTSTTTTPGLERHAAIVRDALHKANRSFDSVSSTCSSSVGELRRAFEFGKKYGLQNYDIPAHLQDSMDDLTLDDTNEDELTFLEHDKLLNMVNLANFSEQPKSSNDIKVQIPLPVRFNGSSDEEEQAVEESEYGKDGLPALSLV